MKFSTKTLIATVALTALMVTPVFATETNINAEINAINNHVNAVGAQVGSYLQTDDGCGAAAKADHTQHADVVKAQVQAVTVKEQANYINYLQACVGNALKDEAAAKQMVTSLTDVVKANPGFQAQLNDATAFYNKKVAERMAAEAAVTNAKAIFAAANAQTDASVTAQQAAAKAADK